MLLGHPGGPYFARKDEGHWTVLKGEIGAEEQPDEVARREFAEETGHPLPDAPMVDLGEIRQAGGKLVVAWAVEGDLDPAQVVSNEFEMQWPPRSGRTQRFPEIDRVQWFDFTAANYRILPAQRPFLDRLRTILADTT